MACVDIRNLQDSVQIDNAKISRFARCVLRLLGESDSELSILFVDDPCIRRLNWQYRKVNAKTDVLAFSMREGKGLHRNTRILGDIVISAETAKRVATKRKEPLKKELYLYLVHGLLHLLGYNDNLPRERKKMRLKEQEILRYFTVKYRAPFRVLSKYNFTFSAMLIL